MLKMQQHRNTQFLGKFVDPMHLGRVNGNVILHLAEPDGAPLDMSPQDVYRARLCRIGSRKPDKSTCMLCLKRGTFPVPPTIFSIHPSPGNSTVVLTRCWLWWAKTKSRGRLL